MKYFGTDGIRGKAFGWLTEELAFRVGAAAGRLFGGSCVLGRDTRVSGAALEEAFARGAAGVGCDVFLLGVLPTPAVSVLAKKLGAGFGAMISASHNPPEYNGIKLFNGQGVKLSNFEEQSLERFIDGALCGESADFGAGAAFGIGAVRGMVSRIDGAVSMYIDSLVAEGRNFFGTGRVGVGAAFGSRLGSSVGTDGTAGGTAFGANSGTVYETNNAESGTGSGTGGTEYGAAFGASFVADSETAGTGFGAEIVTETSGETNVERMALKAETITETVENETEACEPCKNIHDCKTRDFVERRIGGANIFGGSEVWLDCGEGAASGIAREVFERLGARVKSVFDSGDGKKINDGCGALFVENLCEIMKSETGYGERDADGHGQRKLVKNSVCAKENRFLGEIPYAAENNRMCGKEGCEKENRLEHERETCFGGCDLSRGEKPYARKNDRLNFARNTCASGTESLGADRKLSVNNDRFGADERLKEVDGRARGDIGGLRRGELGFAFDGDADRMAMACGGRVLCGDSVLYSMSRVLSLPHGVVVGTVMSNSALERRLLSEGRKLIRAGVGDKNILEVMREGGYSLGGEQSGHYIFYPQRMTGDGVLSAVLMTGAYISDRVFRLELVPQRTVSLACNPSVLGDARLVSLVEMAKMRLSRILVRMSGTEPKVRVMAEGENESLIDEVLAEFAAVIEEINNGVNT